MEAYDDADQQQQPSLAEAAETSSLDRGRRRRRRYYDSGGNGNGCCPELLYLFLGVNVNPGGNVGDNNSDTNNNQNNDGSTTAATAGDEDEAFGGGGVATRNNGVGGVVQTRRIDPTLCYELLTWPEFSNLLCVSKSLRNALQAGIEYVKCRDGNDYRVPYPGYPGLLSSSTSIRSEEEEEDGEVKEGQHHHHHQHQQGLFSHQLASLRAMHAAENRSLHFGALRGGILGDAPGLGKTVTTMALIASTAGMKPVNPPEFWGQQQQTSGSNNNNNNGNDAIQAGWLALRQNPAMRED